MLVQSIVDSYKMNIDEHNSLDFNEQYVLYIHEIRIWTQEFGWEAVIILWCFM